MYNFLFDITELFSLALTVEALQGKTCQDSLLAGEGRSLGAKISWDGVVPGKYFLVSTKLQYKHILLSDTDSANCTVLRAVVLTQYRRVKNGRTDRIAVASTALAMRRVVKTDYAQKKRYGKSNSPLRQY